jgi:small subunit ribosomal protein S8
MVRDYIAEVVNGLKMAGRAKKSTAVLPYSKLVENILEVFKKEGYVTAIDKKGKKVIKYIEVTLNPEMPVNGGERVSHMSKRVYKGSKEIVVSSRLQGFTILTTPKGVMTNKEAKKQNVGGEVLMKIW